MSNWMKRSVRPMIEKPASVIAWAYMSSVAVWITAPSAAAGVALGAGRAAMRSARVR